MKILETLLKGQAYIDKFNEAGAQVKASLAGKRKDQDPAAKVISSKAGKTNSGVRKHYQKSNFKNFSSSVKQSDICLNSSQMRTGSSTAREDRSSLTTLDQWVWNLLSAWT